jgi:AbrB family looped-hinge helix DNA binding protein
MDNIFQGKVFGSCTVGERGQIVIPSELRKALDIKPGDQLMIFAKIDKKVIGLMPEKDFSQFLDLASRLVSKYESGASQKKYMT